MLFKLNFCLSLKFKLETLVNIGPGHYTFTFFTFRVKKKLNMQACSKTYICSTKRMETHFKVLNSVNNEYLIAACQV